MEPPRDVLCRDYNAKYLYKKGPTSESLLLSKRCHLSDEFTYHFIFCLRSIEINIDIV